MRGGVSMHELLHVYDSQDREMLYNIIKENIDATKETRMPLL
jgi:hypothetical protein